MTQTETREDHSLANALAWFQSIKEMADALEIGESLPEQGDAGLALDIAQERIQESVLSVEVRSGWYSPAGGNADSAPAEYRILLTTGGPACQLVGELDEHGEPESARLEHQDWGTPWVQVDLRRMSEIIDPQIVVTPRRGEAPIELRMTADEKAKAYLLTFARQFYFGEG